MSSYYYICVLILACFSLRRYSIISRRKFCQRMKHFIQTQLVKNLSSRFCVSMCSFVVAKLVKH